MRIGKAPLVELKTDASDAPPPPQTTNDLGQLLRDARAQAPKLLGFAAIAADAAGGTVVIRNRVD